MAKTNEKAGQPMNKFLEGKQIYLRPLSKADIPIWYSWFNSQELTEHMNKGAFPNTKEAQEEFFQQLVSSKNDVQLAIMFKKEDSLSGIIGIHKIDWIHRRGDVSILVASKNLWGKGIATEAISLVTTHAFTKMNLHRLTAGVWTGNIAAKRSFEKVGFVVEGTLREHYFYQGSYTDSYTMGLLKDEWGQAQDAKKGK